MSWKAEKQKWIKRFSCSAPTGGQSDSAHGTPAGEMNKEIRKHFRGVKRCKPNLRAIEKHLKRGGAVICHVRTATLNHWVFIDRVSPGGVYFWAANMYSLGPAYRPVSRRELLSMLRRPKSTYKPWLIPPRRLDTARGGRYNGNAAPAARGGRI